jgi:predicted nucleotidyltransferase
VSNRRCYNSFMRHALAARLEPLLRALAPEYGYSIAVLFGSAARTPERARDVDIAVDAPLDLDQRVALARRFEDALGRPVDLVRLGPSTSELLAFEVFRAGVCLFEAAPGAFAEARRRAVLRHWDEGPYFRRRRREYLDRAIGREDRARGA